VDASEDQRSLTKTVPARILWDQEALGWTGRDVYVRLPDPRLPVHRGLAGRGGRAAPLARKRIDIAGGQRTMTIVGKFLCMIGVHRWLHKRNPEGVAQYLECERCQKQKDTMSLTDHGGGGAGGFG
jgi:hypothetical protein